MFLVIVYVTLSNAEHVDKYYYVVIYIQFYLQDTKSSNGTFVNSSRLSKGSEESSPTEVCSGDTIQFGVDVMENSRKGQYCSHVDNQPALTHSLTEYWIRCHFYASAVHNMHKEA